MITIEKRYHESLWILTLNEGTHAAVDAWESAVRDYIKTFDNRPERYLIYDTTPIRNLGFTPYLRTRATILAEDNRDATGRVAIVLHLPDIITRLFDFFVRYNGRRIQPNLQVQLFTQRAAAIAWVEAILPAELRDTQPEAELVK